MKYRRQSYQRCWGSKVHMKNSPLEGNPEVARWNGNDFRAELAQGSLFLGYMCPFTQSILIEPLQIAWNMFSCFIHWLIHQKCMHWEQERIRGVESRRFSQQKGIFTSIEHLDRTRHQSLSSGALTGRLVSVSLMNCLKSLCCLFSLWSVSQHFLKWP